MFICLREAHGDKGLGREGVAFENRDIEELVVFVAVCVVVKGYVAPA